MGNTRAASVTLIALAFVLPWTDCLLCYQCGSAGLDGGSCKQEVKDLLKSANTVLKKLENSSSPEVGDKPQEIFTDEGVTIPHIKLCDYSRPTCIIEEVQNSQTSAVLSYIRDCSDGKTFSFENMTFLQNLTPNNFSTCAYDVKGYLICVTLCNTDFCNGPKASVAPSIVFSTALLLVGLTGVQKMMTHY